MRCEDEAVKLKVSAPVVWSECYIDRGPPTGERDPCSTVGRASQWMALVYLERGVGLIDTGRGDECPHRA